MIIKMEKPTFVHLFGTFISEWRGFLLRWEIDHISKETKGGMDRAWQVRNDIDIQTKKLLFLWN